MLDGLAFLPVDQVQHGIRHLRTIVPDVVESDKLESLLDYFDSTYVSGTARRIQPPGGTETSIRIRRIPALFPPAIWNVHQATLDGADRTNNQCESWNSSFCHLLGYTKHPSLFVLIEALQRAGPYPASG